LNVFLVNECISVQKTNIIVDLKELHIKKWIKLVEMMSDLWKIEGFIIKYEKKIWPCTYDLNEDVGLSI